MKTNIIVAQSTEQPYHNLKPRSYFEIAALSVITALQNRAGFSEPFNEVETEVRAELVAKLTQVIEEALKPLISEPMEEFDRLIHYFRNEGSEFGDEGDDKGWSAVDTAIEMMERYRTHLDRPGFHPHNDADRDDEVIVGDRNGNFALVKLRSAGTGAGKTVIHRMGKRASWSAYYIQGRSTGTIYKNKYEPGMVKIPPTAELPRASRVRFNLGGIPMHAGYITESGWSLPPGLFSASKDGSTFEVLPFDSSEIGASNEPELR